MPDPILAQDTSFTLDTVGRYICNTLDEAVASSSQSIADERRDFDVIVVGGGTFGSIIAQHLFAADATHSRRILVLENGPFVLPEHVQNLPFLATAAPTPPMRAPWKSRSDLGYPGLLFAIGGRSLAWGGWSPELLDAETQAWPASVLNDLRGKGHYFHQASEQIGVTHTNDFIYGPLHAAMRRQLHDGLAALGAVPGSLPLSTLPEHPATRYNGTTTVAELRELLGLPASDATPEAELRNLLKLEAPLAVQAQNGPGLFPFNKFSAMPLLIRAVREASEEADGAGLVPDARKRLLIVPKVHVQELITETQSDGWVRVKGVRVTGPNGVAKEIMLAPPRDGRQGAVILALGTIETTRIALQTFKHSLAGRAASRMGKNLMAHLRSNLDMRVHRQSLHGLPPAQFAALQSSALFVKGKATIRGVDRYFHLQVTASGLGKLGTGSEAELFKKIPDLDNVLKMTNATDTHVVITLRGIGEMLPQNPDSFIDLSPYDSDFDRPAAWVQLGDAKGAPPGVSAQTQADAELWEAMDSFTDQVALIFAKGEAFEILAGGRTIPVAAGADAAQVKAALPHAARRDKLGTTHHDAGTLWMGDNPAASVTNEFGRIHDTTNCYAVGPALFPSVGSPNPMLTGTALARRTADLLTEHVLEKPTVPATEAGFIDLFDGKAGTFGKWRRVGAPGTGFALLHGQIVTYGGGPISLLYFATEAFNDFQLKLEFRIFAANAHNSGVFLRFRDPLTVLPPVLQARASAAGDDVAANPALGPVHSGFEVQIDDNARGDSRRDFYGIRPEPDGLWKNRTGAIYKVPAGDFIWQLGRNDDRFQEYQPGPALQLGRWFEYDITVQGDTYTVFLTDLESGQRLRTTRFQNMDPERGRGSIGGAPAGYVGLQSYPESPVAFRRIRLKKL